MWSGSLTTQSHQLTQRSLCVICPFPDHTDTSADVVLSPSDFDMDRDHSTDHHQYPVGHQCTVHSVESRTDPERVLEQQMDFLIEAKERRLQQHVPIRGNNTVRCHLK